MVGAGFRGVSTKVLPLCTVSSKSCLMMDWCPRARCPCTAAGGLGAGDLLCPAQTMLLHARLGKCLHDLFEIQICAWTQQSRLGLPGARLAQRGRKRSKIPFSVPIQHGSSVVHPMEVQDLGFLVAASSIRLDGGDSGLGCAVIPEAGVWCLMFGDSKGRSSLADPRSADVLPALTSMADSTDSSVV